MNDALKCTDCGDDLPADSAAGLCAKCMMKLGFETGNGPVSETGAADTTDMNGGEERSRIDFPELPELFPELEIFDKLGSGGMGVVVLAKQRNLDRKVALKILRTDLAKDPSFSERFTREARALARLSHPSIIGVHDFGQRGDLYYFIMEYVDGSNLRHVVTEGKLQPAEALAIVPQICDALQYAHDEGVVHRDIKPENILIDQRGRVKIADFGLAKIVGTEASDFTLTGTRQVMGTPHYMAPEQMERPQDVDHRADIYSLGVVFYEMLTGELPLGRFAPPSKKVEINVRLDEVVMRTLAKEPELRYQQVTEVKTQVEKIGDAGPSIATSINQSKDRVLERLGKWANATREMRWGKKVESARENIAAGTKVAAAGLGAAGAYGYAAGESAASFSKDSATGLWSRRKQVWQFLRNAIAWTFGAVKYVIGTVLGWLGAAWRSIRRLLVWMLAWTVLCAACFGIFGHKWFRENARMEYTISDSTAQRLTPVSGGELAFGVHSYGHGRGIVGWNPPASEFRRDRIHIHLLNIEPRPTHPAFHIRVIDEDLFYAYGKHAHDDDHWMSLENDQPIAGWINSHVKQSPEATNAQAVNLFQIANSFRIDGGVIYGTVRGNERKKGLRTVSSLIDDEVFHITSRGVLHPRCHVSDWFITLIGSVVGSTLAAGYGLILYLPYRRWRKKNAKAKEERDTSESTRETVSNDELYEQAVEVIIKEGRGSVSVLQRELGIGYGRAARLIDSMADEGVVGKYNGTQPREVLMTAEDWAAKKPS